MKSPSDKTPPLPSLSEAEWEVMKVFWDRGELAARDVYAQ
jgi:BlaI family transcriptional regulator, penicillinase repressor